MDIAAKLAAAEKIRVLRDTADLIGSQHQRDPRGRPNTAERELAQTLLREWAGILEDSLGVEQDPEHTPWATA